MRANASTTEPKYRKRCTSELYEWQMKRFKENPEKYPLWVTHDGPPYANGSPHIGHSLNKILKDIVNRYQLLRGNTVSYIPGWDCHGLPIELKAIQENKEMLQHQYEKVESAILLRKEAKKVASKAIKIQQKHFMEWGVMGEWEKPYLTLLPSYESAQIEVFYEMYKKGYIYRGVRPVHWSPSSNTALAEAELEYPEVYKSLSAFCGFSLIPSTFTEEFKKTIESLQKTKENQYPDINLLIWTTTPWTLPANKGVCIHSDIKYCIVDIQEKNNERKSPNYFIVSKNRMEYLQSTLENKELLFVKDIQSSDSLLGMEYHGLYFNGKVYEADFVTDVSGTGLVHTAPGHGHDDFRVLTGKYKVDPFCPVDNHGKYTNEIDDELTGIDVLTEGNTKIIEKLKSKNMLIYQHDFYHKYPHDWRTKKPIIIRTTKQWFTDLRSLIPKAISQLKNVQMIPSSGNERFTNILQQREDWCISRQRCWGVPIPVFFDKNSNDNILINDETISHLIELFKKHGVDCWWSMSVKELLPPSYADSYENYERCFDTVDVWFDSGCSWYSVIHQNKLPKSDLYLEGSDQYRGWFQSSLLTSTAVTNEAPYKRILTHGFVLDGEGRKMSKSLGNVIDPAVILRGGENSPTAYGSDILRFWCGSVDFTKDVNISYDYIQILSETKRKIRNTIRFMLGNMNDLDDLVNYNSLPNIDKYMLAELYQFANYITEFYDSFQYSKVSTLITQFCIVDFSSFYFEAIKDRLYADGTESLSRRSAQTVLAHALALFTKALSPIMCHMSEEIFENIPKNLIPALFNVSATDEIFSIFQTGWFTVPSSWNNSSMIEQWKLIKSCKDSINLKVEQLRRDKEIKQGMEAAVELTVPANSPLTNALFDNEEFLHLAFNVSSICIVIEPNITDLEVRVAKSSKLKCQRCWLYLAEDESNCLCEVRNNNL